MLTYPEDEWELEDAKRLNAEPWMLDLLKLNPEYNCWGPGEDYMCEKGDGWRASAYHDTWNDFGPWELNELNECVHFHFEVGRKSVECESCDQSGYNQETHKISEDFYDFARAGRRWVDNVTQDEADVLAERGRIRAGTTAEELNAANGMAHDAINRGILIEARAKRLGVWGLCEKCQGHGYVHTAPGAHVSLVLWMLHPRKGAARGVEIKCISKEELPAVFAWLREADKRNRDRFAKIPEA